MCVRPGEMKNPFVSPSSAKFWFVDMAHHEILPERLM